MAFGIVSRLRKRICAVILGLVLGLVLTEIVLRSTTSFGSHKYKYYPRPPNLQMVFNPRSDLIPGVTGISRFNANFAGIRADEFDDKQNYRILVLGGSAVECLYLDQDESWPHLLQDKLNECGKLNVWVGNTGASGHHSANHILYLKHLIPQYPTVNAVILLVGVNDLGMALCSFDFGLAAQIAGATEKDRLPRSFAIHPYGEQLPFFKKLAIWQLL
jgi:hypothetical protein